MGSATVGWWAAFMPRKGYSSCTAERSRGIVSPLSSVVPLRGSDTHSTIGSQKSCEQQLFQRPGSSPLARPLFCTQTLHVPVGPATGGGLAATFSLSDTLGGRGGCWLRVHCLCSRSQGKYTSFPLFLNGSDAYLFLSGDAGEQETLALELGRYVWELPYID